MSPTICPWQWRIFHIVPWHHPFVNCQQHYLWHPNHVRHPINRWSPTIMILSYIMMMHITIAKCCFMNLYVNSIPHMFQHIRWETWKEGGDPMRFNFFNKITKTGRKTLPLGHMLAPLRRIVSHEYHYKMSFVSIFKTISLIPFQQWVCKLYEWRGELLFSPLSCFKASGFHI